MRSVILPFRGAGEARRAFVLFSACGLLMLSGPRTDPRSIGASVRVQEFTGPADTGMFQVGEELDYKVSYLFFNIGTIHFQVVDRQQNDGVTVYRARTIIDSNPGLSWLTNVHIRFYGEMDENVFSYQLTSDDSSSREVNFRRMRFEYGAKRMIFEKGKKSAAGERIRESADTVEVVHHCQDGMSLFFYARKHARENREEHIPTFIDNKEASTYIHFLNERTSAEVDSVPYPVDVVRFDGRADFVGIFGLTGGFEGWFSNDTACVPILARMKVILGSVKVQLTRWNRPGWRPPKYSGQ